MFLILLIILLLASISVAFIAYFTNEKKNSNENTIDRRSDENVLNRKEIVNTSDKIDSKSEETDISVKSKQ